MPSEINGEIQNAQPEIHQEIQIKKEGEVKNNETAEKDVENGAHKEAESDVKPPIEESNGNGTQQEENGNSETPVTTENPPESTEITSEVVESEVKEVETTETPSVEENVETEEVEEKVETHVEPIVEHDIVPFESTETQEVSENTASQNEEPVSENVVCERPVPEVIESPVEQENHVEVEEVPPPKEEQEPAVAEVAPAVDIRVTETPVETPAEEKMTIDNYAQKIENEKHRQVEKEYTKEVIESEVPARIVQEVKKGLFESGSRSPGNSEQGHQNGIPKKSSMITSVDESSVKSAYEDVRNDNSATQWAVFKFEGAKIKCSATGAQFDKFQEQFDDKERAFGFIRVQTGDEMSKRQKFLFITWVGPSVSVLQRAKMSTDKSFIKNIISNFAVELQLENQSEIDLKHFVNELNKAGGAHYGTGIRDN